MPIGEECDSALDSSVAFRDDTEALRARIESLESELGEAKKTIARMKGADESVSVDIVPKRFSGWKRRVRRFRGALSEEDYEHLARLIPEMTMYPTKGVERTTATFSVGSQREIVVVAREGDDLVVVFDEADQRMRQVFTPLALTSLPWVFMLNGRPEWLGPMFAALAMLSILAVHALFAREDKLRFAKGDELFEAVGAYIERTLAVAPLAEAAVAEEEELEVEQRSAPKTMEA